MKPRVVVVGAGIVGSSIAWRLSQRGVAVTLLDNGPLQGQASAAGAGMLAPGAEVSGPSPWSSLATASAAMYAGFVAELKAAAGGGANIDFRSSGAVEIAWDDTEWRVLDLRATRQARLGIESRWLSRKELAAHVPALAGDRYGAIYYPRDGVVDARDVVRLLHRLCPPTRAQVTGIESRAGSGVVVYSGGEWINADAAVLAAGAWSSGVAVEIDGQPYPLPESFPVRGHLLGYRIAPGRLGPILRHGHTYLLQRRSGVLVAGTSEERVGFDSSLDEETVTGIHERAMALIPGLLRGAAFDSWIGFRPGIAADAPAIGAVGGSRLWLAYGHYRNGILLAPATAHRVAGEITASLEKG